MRCGGEPQLAEVCGNMEYCCTLLETGKGMGGWAGWGALWVVQRCAETWSTGALCQRQVRCSRLGGLHCWRRCVGTCSTGAHRWKQVRE